MAICIIIKCSSPWHHAPVVQRFELILKRRGKTGVIDASLNKNYYYYYLSDSFPKRSKMFMRLDLNICSKRLLPVYSRSVSYTPLAPPPPPVRPPAPPLAPHPPPNHTHFLPSFAIKCLIRQIKKFLKTISVYTVIPTFFFFFFL